MIRGVRRYASPMAEETPLITVVTVCRNPGPALLPTAQSVLGQTGVSFEYLVIDGASSDGTPAFLAQLKDPRASFVSEPDGGIYDAMNKGVRKARGQWIFFLNAGDTLITPTSLATLAFQAKEGVDHVAAGLLLRWPDGVTSPCLPPGLTPLHMPVLHPATLSRAARLREHPFDVSFRIAGDMDFFLGEIARNAKFTFIPDMVSRFGLDGISSTRTWSTHLESRRAILRHTRFTLGSRIVLECRLLARYLVGPAFMALRHAKEKRAQQCTHCGH